MGTVLNFSQLICDLMVEYSRINTYFIKKSQLSDCKYNYNKEALYDD